MGLLHKQQLSVVTAVAKEIDANLMDRQSDVQARLEQRPLLQLLFNGGAWVATRDGIAIADVPLSAQRLGVNYASVDFVAAALKEGKTRVEQLIEAAVQP